ncbi:MULTISPECIES: tryptophan synthase subunit alpha [Marinobacter]|jgi:tryptophan synthase alpha chain|uniref:Tryptophan synthase alpha chain n=2 Tax=Marinobacter TaxID=2742 RepID=A0A1M2UYV3_MARNT|nr:MULTISPECIES: tryptophan synthase subunit alpha [Marinobacter]WBU43115.1 tryptophan synthase subunit alpha [Marinobacter alkaliphilus]MAO12318.1 tryptophan synthase subunit alpha [Marinobacter sp.]OJT00507.1 tryptophan synthase subunit alpha [Marinobacter nauticus]QFS87009.1 Tryptophan synthase alpha chain [Marinobacter sp. THAF197a]QFT50793.1 Tryptophan synthase alpha chain [Marinobacter sp. THAF39]
MSRIEGVLKSLKEQGRKALIPYITAGDPEPGQTVSLMHTLVDAGSDIIELGVPFSDPMADGPVIQLACERALVHGTSLRQVIGMVKEFRKTNTTTPVVLMGYLNPMEAMGYEAFADAAADAGVDGILTVDLPPEEAEDVAPLFSARNMDPIFLLAPTTTDERIKAISEHSSGYVYYVSIKGVTGSATINVDEVAKKVAHVHELTALPVGVGFGIRDAETAAAVGKVSDGVIVGSVLVDTIARHQTDPEALAKALTDLLHPMREALDSLAS